LLHDLAVALDVLPTSLIVEGVNVNPAKPARDGQYADIFCAKVRQNVLCVKRLRLFGTPEETFVFSRVKLYVPIVGMTLTDFATGCRTRSRCLEAIAAPERA
jgi:hypothetical protein